MNDIAFLLGPPVAPPTGYREPVYGFDHRGEPIVTLPLAGSPRPCVLDRADFERVVGILGTYQWRRNTSTVQATKRGIGIARLITEATELDYVSYMDGDRLNLRRSNLLLLPVKRWMKARKMVFVDQSTLVIPVGRPH